MADQLDFTHFPGILSFSFPLGQVRDDKKNYAMPASAVIYSIGPHTRH